MTECRLLLPSCVGSFTASTHTVRQSLKSYHVSLIPFVLFAGNRMTPLPCLCPLLLNSAHPDSSTRILHPPLHPPITVLPKQNHVLPWPWSFLQVRLLPPSAQVCHLISGKTRNRKSIYLFVYIESRKRFFIKKRKILPRMEVG